MKKLRTLLRRQKGDAILITNAENVRYLCGFTGSDGWLLIKARSAILVTDTRYEEQANEEVHEAGLLIAVKERLSEALARSGVLKGVRALVFEADNVTFANHRTLKKLFTGIRLIPATGITDPLREIKSSSELLAVRRAVEAAEFALKKTLPLLKTGVSEQSIAAQLSFYFREAGANADAFPPIVLFGARTSLPHGSPGANRLKRRQPILIDIGCKVDGYCSDFTRMFTLGNAAQKFGAVYSQLLHIQNEARSAVRDGVPVKTLDAQVRSNLASHGLDTYFNHALGHGIGLDVHEAPILSSRSTEVLTAGQIVTIEPGVYFPGNFGIRIEDDVLVQANGSETLTTFPRELMEL